MTSQQRRRHIATARELARDLRFAAGRFDPLSLRDLDPPAFWSALQPDPELVERFRAFLEQLWFDGIRSRFFADLEASKLILPLAAEIAERLETLVDELEMQAAGSEECGTRARRATAELRIQN